MLPSKPDEEERVEKPQLAGWILLCNRKRECRGTPFKSVVRNIIFGGGCYYFKSSPVIAVNDVAFLAISGSSLGSTGTKPLSAK